MAEDGKSPFKADWSLAGSDESIAAEATEKGRQFINENGWLDPSGAPSQQAVEEMTKQAQCELNDADEVFAEVAPLLRIAADDECARTFSIRADALRNMLAEMRADHPLKSMALSILLISRLRDLAERNDAFLIRGQSDLIDHVLTCALIVRNGANNAHLPKLPDAESVRWRKLEKGIFFAKVAGEFRYGPQVVHLLRADPGAVELVCIATSRDQRISLAELAAKNGCRHGVTGGFHLFAETNLHPAHRRGDPVGLIVTDGKVVSPPAIERTALIQDDKNHWHIRRIGLKGVTVGFGPSLKIAIRRVDPKIIKPGEPCAFTPTFGKKIPLSRRAWAASFVGVRVALVGVGEQLAIPDAGFVLAVDPGAGSPGLLESVRTGDEVSYSLPKIAGLGQIENAMAGGPRLLDNGKIEIDLAGDCFDGLVAPATFGGPTTVHRNFLPRMAAGICADYSLIAMAVEGRDPQNAVGMSLDDCARVLKRLGCVNAVNLDGGASKRLLADGVEMDIHADSDNVEKAPRAVRTAILWRK